VSQSNEFCRHNPLYCFSTSVFVVVCVYFFNDSVRNFWIHPRISCIYIYIAEEFLRVIEGTTVTRKQENAVLQQTRFANLLVLDTYRMCTKEYHLLSYSFLLHLIILSTITRSVDRDVTAPSRECKEMRTNSHAPKGLEA
jgi:hypothetical protein